MRASLQAACAAMRFCIPDRPRRIQLAHIQPTHAHTCAGLRSPCLRMRRCESGTSRRAWCSRRPSTRSVLHLLEPAFGLHAAQAGWPVRPASAGCHRRTLLVTPMPFACPAGPGLAHGWAQRRPCCWGNARCRTDALQPAMPQYLQGRVYCMAGSSAGRVLATCGEDCYARLWDTERGTFKASCVPAAAPRFALASRKSRQRLPWGALPPAVPFLAAPSSSRVFPHSNLHFVAGAPARSQGAHPVGRLFRRRPPAGHRLARPNRPAVGCAHPVTHPHGARWGQKRAPVALALACQQCC